VAFTGAGQKAGLVVPQNISLCDDPARSETTAWPQPGRIILCSSVKF